MDRHQKAPAHLILHRGLRSLIDDAVDDLFLLFIWKTVNRKIPERVQKQGASTSFSQVF